MFLFLKKVSFEQEPPEKPLFSSLLHRCVSKIRLRLNPRANFVPWFVPKKHSEKNRSSSQVCFKERFFSWRMVLLVQEKRSKQCFFRNNTLVVKQKSAFLLGNEPQKKNRFFFFLVFVRELRLSILTRWFWAVLQKLYNHGSSSLACFKRRRTAPQGVVSCFFWNEPIS